MDDEKSIAEKLTDAITKATDTVKSTMSNIVDTASQAAQYAMENHAERMSGQTAAALAPGRPEVADAAAMPVPLFAVQPVPKKRAHRTKLSSGKMPPAKKPVAKKVAKKSAPKKARKGAKKSAKKNAKKNASKKTAKRIAKKSAKKARKKTKNRSKR
jgi:hypothetical protein